MVLGLRSVCWYQQYTSSNLLAGSVLGHRLGALADSVLGELTGEKETHSSLDLSGGDGGTLVVVGQTGGLGSDALEDVIHERVHDRHGLGGDTSVGVHLLQHFVYVDRIALLAFPFAFLVPSPDCFSLAGLLGTLRTDLRWHIELYS